jgi:hypothetical protein
VKHEHCIPNSYDLVKRPGDDFGVEKSRCLPIRLPRRRPLETSTNGLHGLLGLLQCLRDTRNIVFYVCHNVELHQKNTKVASRIGGSVRRGIKTACGNGRIYGNCAYQMLLKAPSNLYVLIVGSVRLGECRSVIG